MTGKKPGRPRIQTRNVHFAPESGPLRPTGPAAASQCEAAAQAKILILRRERLLFLYQHARPMTALNIRQGRVWVDSASSFFSGVNADIGRTNYRFVKSLLTGEARERTFCQLCNSTRFA
jgi:hypothetical protein